MSPTQPGQIVKFAKPLSEDEAEQMFVILEIFFDVERPRAIVRYLDGSDLSSTHTYLVSELELA